MLESYTSSQSIVIDLYNRPPDTQENNNETYIGLYKKNQNVHDFFNGFYGFYPF